MSDTVVRTLRFLVGPTDRSHWPVVKNSIKTYRVALSHAASALAGLEMIGATTSLKGDDLRVVPASLKDSLVVRRDLFGLEKGEPIYRVLKKLLPDTWLADMADRATQTLVSVWKARDAELGGQRRYWVMNGVRRVPMFTQANLGFRPRNVKIDPTGHRVTLQWCKELGPIEFHLGTIDPGSWAWWRRIVSGELKMGEVKLRLFRRKGKDCLQLMVPYERPVRKDKSLSPSRSVEAAFDDSNPACFLRCKLVGGQRTLLDLIRHDELNAVAALDRIDQMSTRDERLKELKKACGSERRGTGHHKASRYYNEKRKFLSAKRIEVVRTWNHTWTKQLVQVCQRNKAGKLVLTELSDTLFTRSWRWYEFQQQLASKLEEAGIEFENRNKEKVKETA